MRTVQSDRWKLIQPVCQFADVAAVSGRIAISPCRGLYDDDRSGITHTALPEAHLIFPLDWLQRLHVVSGQWATSLDVA